MAMFLISLVIGGWISVLISPDEFVPALSMFFGISLFLFAVGMTLTPFILPAIARLILATKSGFQTSNKWLTRKGEAIYAKLAEKGVVPKDEPPQDKNQNSDTDKKDDDS